MPTRKAGSPTSSNAAARRSASPSPRCGMTSKPRGSHGPGSPSSTTTRRPAQRARGRGGERVRAAPRGRARRPAPGVHGGVRRVLTRPGTGALAITSRAGGTRLVACPSRDPDQSDCQTHRKTLVMSRTARAVPVHRAGDLRAPVARVVGDLDLADRPARRPPRAAPSPAASRSGGRGSRARAARSRGAARIGPRSRSGTPVRRRSSSASTAFAARACTGQAPRAVGRRAPSIRSAAPSRTGSATRGRSRGSNDASQSMKHTIVALRRAQPGEAGRAEAGPRLDARPARRATPRARPSRRSSRCRRRSARSRRASARAPTGSPRAR